MANRDVLAELDSIEEFLKGLIGEDPLPGQDSNLKRLDAEFSGVRALAQNVVELDAEYKSGVTHEQRVAKSMGVDADPSAGRIAELERQLAEARAGAPSDG